MSLASHYGGQDAGAFAPDPSAGFAYDSLLSVKPRTFKKKPVLCLDAAALEEDRHALFQSAARLVGEDYAPPAEAPHTRTSLMGLSRLDDEDEGEGQHFEEAQRDALAAWQVPVIAEDAAAEADDPYAAEVAAFIEARKAALANWQANAPIDDEEDDTFELADEGFASAQDEALAAWQAPRPLADDDADFEDGAYAEPVADAVPEEPCAPAPIPVGYGDLPVATAEVQPEPSVEDIVEAQPVEALEEPASEPVAAFSPYAEPELEPLPAYVPEPPMADDPLPVAAYASPDEDTLGADAGWADGPIDVTPGPEPEAHWEESRGRDLRARYAQPPVEADKPPTPLGRVFGVLKSFWIWLHTPL